MLIAFFVIWMILNGRIGVDVLLSGLVIALAGDFLTRRALGVSYRRTLGRIKKLPTLLELFLVLIAEIFKANLHVLGWIYRPGREREPVIVEFDPGLKTEMARVALADCITLTPGTITGDLSESGRYLVHCLDRSMAEGLDRSHFVRLLSELEGGEGS